MNLFEGKRPYQKLGQFLKQELIKGSYQVGDRLPPEREIAEQLQVSRTVVREAIIMLELENLVEVKQGSGVYVIHIPCEQASLELPESMDSEVGPFEMLQARQLLESNIAEFAATQVTPANIAEMRAALNVEAQAQQAGKVSSEGDKNFHLCIAKATQNSLLVDLAKQLWTRREQSPMWRQLHSRIHEANYQEAWIEDHAKILAALQRKDPQAAKQAMWQHLENVKQRLFELSDIDDPNFDGYLFSSNPVIF